MSRGGVLIVDDDLALLEALPQALRLQLGGVTVETADSAAGPATSSRSRSTGITSWRRCTVRFAPAC